MPNADIQVNASQKDVLQILAAQYSQLDQGEARALLERLHKPVWSNEELLDHFEVAYFEPPFVHVIRKSDGVKGAVIFIDTPRLYFDFQPEENNDAGSA